MVGKHHFNEGTNPKKSAHMKFDIQLQAAQSHFSNNTLEMEDLCIGC